ncbi:glycosyltransferase family 4 protein [Plantibacter sp. T3]|uniref:glycosyltransferase family 4 protein n=1 Tax=Plantibacter sp. T3 TaxID=2653161 RepID=UPI0012EF29F6|nr:glycosyltransferase family 4 protein [Plantibacter sp. T3]VXC53355.1 conserved hypothetical protein [Plantibacter sp. T3]
MSGFRDPRVTFVSSAAAAWGAETSIRLIAQELVKRGYRVRVVVSSETAAKFFRQEPGINTVQISHSHSSRLSRWRAFSRYLLTTNEPTERVVVCSVNLYMLGPLSILWRRRDVLTAIDLHDSFSSPMMRARIRIMALLFDRAIYISNFIGGMVSKNRHAYLIPRPITAEIQQEALPVNPLKVGLVGRIVPEKNIELAIDAVAPMANTELHVFGSSFGSDHYAEELSRYAAARKAPVYWRGRQDADSLYKEISVLLVVNEREASGRTVGEALARGIPVVVPSRGGAGEFFDARHEGYVWEADSGAKSIRLILEGIQADPSAARSASSLGRLRVREERSLTRVVDQYASALGLPVAGTELM